MPLTSLLSMNAWFIAEWDMQGLVDARDEILKNVVIVYSQASVRYASKMTDDLANGDTSDYDKHQAEGHAFYRVIEAYVAEYTSICYNMVSHTVSSDTSQASCEAYMYLENYTSSNDPDGEEFTLCYNSVVRMRGCHRRNARPSDGTQTITPIKSYKCSI